jgi:hypothetical protein
MEVHKCPICGTLTPGVHNTMLCAPCYRNYGAGDPGAK